MYFSTFEQKCILCQRWQSHIIISSKTELDLQKHNTCICNLMDYGTVCCYIGYKTLINDEKDLLMYTPPSPKGSNFFLNLYGISPCFMPDDEIELVHQCKILRIDLLHEKTK